MISKYFRLTFGLIVSILIFSSCLGSSADRNYEYSPDAQIYSFTMSSRADTAGILSSTSFTIDQINGLIFNEELLPYQFHVDSAVLNIRNSVGFNNVSLKLRPDTSFSWSQTDSIDINNLSEIITTAEDGETTKRYVFQLNTHMQDPYILSWNSVTNNFLPASTIQNKTISFNGRFISYYKSGATIGAVTSPYNDGETWTEANIIGLPDDIQFSSLKSSGEALFVIDEEGRVYSSEEGLNWTYIPTDYPVEAIYGVLPSPSHSGVLAVVKDNDNYSFALTDDFTKIDVMNDFPANIPVADYSSTTVESASSFAVKYIIVAGGSNIDGSDNNDIWILQEKDGIITRLKSKAPGSVSLEGSTLFFYDNNPYLLISSSEGNSLMFSENNGLEWTLTGENQKLPEGFRVRSNASVITDSDNYIWIFGGVSETQTILSDVWKGRLNKFVVN